MGRKGATQRRIPFPRTIPWERNAALMETIVHNFSLRLLLAQLALLLPLGMLSWYAGSSSAGPQLPSTSPPKASPDPAQAAASVQSRATLTKYTPDPRELRQAYEQASQ